MGTSSPSKRTPSRLLVALSLGAAASLLLSSCASQEEAGDTGSSSTLSADLTAAAKAEAGRIADGKKLSGTISFIGENSGSEGDILKSVYKPFEDATGVKINYTGSGDSNALIQSRVTAGNPPDVVSTSTGVMSDYKKSHNLLNLSSFMESELKENYPQSVLDSASIDGDVYGVYQGFNNYMMWVNPKTYSGPKEGSSWSDVVSWTEKEAAAGQPAWCNAQGAGPSSGFPGETMIEALFAKKYGPELTQDWATGKLPWTSPQVKDAWQMYGALMTKDANVAGGVTASLTQDIGVGSNGLVSNPPGCLADIWGSWTGGLVGSSSKDVKPGQDLDFMTIPASDPRFEKTETYSAKAYYAFTDNEAVRAFMQYIASTPAQTLLASANHWTVSNMKVTTDTYTDPLLRKMAEKYFSKDVVLAVAPSNVAKDSVIQGAYAGVIKYLQDPSQLDSILQSIQNSQAASS